MLKTAKKPETVLYRVLTFFFSLHYMMDYVVHIVTTRVHCGDIVILLDLICAILLGSDLHDITGVRFAHKIEL